MKLNEICTESAMTEIPNSKAKGENNEIALRLLLAVDKLANSFALQDKDRHRASELITSRPRLLTLIFYSVDVSNDIYL